MPLTLTLTCTRQHTITHVIPHSHALTDHNRNDSSTSEHNSSRKRPASSARSSSAHTYSSDTSNIDTTHVSPSSYGSRTNLMDPQTGTDTKTHHIRILQQYKQQLSKKRL